jgi:hypothetical protein
VLFKGFPVAALVAFPAGFVSHVHPKVFHCLSSHTFWWCLQEGGNSKDLAKSLAAGLAADLAAKSQPAATAGQGAASLVQDAAQNAPGLAAAAGLSAAALALLPGPRQALLDRWGIVAASLLPLCCSLAAMCPFMSCIVCCRCLLLWSRLQLQWKARWLSGHGPVLPGAHTRDLLP